MRTCAFEEIRNKKKLVIIIIIMKEKTGHFHWYSIFRTLIISKRNETNIELSKKKDLKFHPEQKITKHKNCHFNKSLFELFSLFVVFRIIRVFVTFFCRHCFYVKYIPINGYHLYFFSIWFPFYLPFLLFFGFYCAIPNIFLSTIFFCHLHSFIHLVFKCFLLMLLLL